MNEKPKSCMSTDELIKAMRCCSGLYNGNCKPCPLNVEKKCWNLSGFDQDITVDGKLLRIAADRLEQLVAEKQEADTHIKAINNGLNETLRCATQKDKIMTNGDHIRSMSNEELRDLMEDAENAGYNDTSIVVGKNNYPADKLDYLNQPYVRRPKPFP